MKLISNNYVILIIFGFFILGTISYLPLSESIDEPIPSEASTQSSQSKFDVGFFDKIQNKIIQKNTLLNCLGSDFNPKTSIDDFISSQPSLDQECLEIIQDSQGTIDNLIQEIDYYDVIIFVNRDSPKDRNESSPAEQNKNVLVSNLQTTFGAKNVQKANSLSFVTAQVPIAKISDLANYNQTFLIGDGQSEVQFQLDVSKGVINAEPAQVSGFSGKGVTVVIIDSGMRQDHDDLFPPSNSTQVVIDQIVCEDISGNIECPSSSTDYSDWLAISGGHGTGSAGIIAGQGLGNSTKKGVAPDSHLVNVKTFTPTDVIAHSLDFVLTNYPDSVVNMSFGKEEDAGEYTMISLIADEGVDRGLFVIASAGNEGGKPDPTVTPPASGFNVIAVGNMVAVDPEDPSSYAIHSSSSIGPLDSGRLKPDVVAPGSPISAPDGGLFNPDGYSFYTGTSFSSPHVAGAVAILLEANPDYKPIEIKAALIAGADWHGPAEYDAVDYDNQVNAVDVNEWGFGLINVTKSLELSTDGKIFRENIPEDGDVSDNFSLSVEDGVPTKVFLTWFTEPGGDIFNPIDTIRGDLTLTIYDENGIQQYVSDSDIQNTEFVIFTPTITSDQWTITVTSEDNFNPPGTIIEYVLASTNEIGLDQFYSGLNMEQDGVTEDVDCNNQLTLSSFATIPMAVSSTLDCGGNPNKTDIFKITSSSTNETDLLMFYANNGGYEKLTRVEGQDSENNINFKSKRVGGTLTLTLYETDANGNILEEEANKKYTITKNQQITIDDISELRTLISANNTFGIKSSFKADSSTSSDLTLSWGLHGGGNGKEFLVHVNENQLGGGGLVFNETKISSTSGNFLGPLDDEDSFGVSVADIGDFNGDGVTDIAVGAPGDDDGGDRPGAFWMLFLNSDGTVKSHQKISSTSGNFTGDLDDQDSFGRGITMIGDLDGDEINELAVGAIGNDEGSPDEGAVYILFLNSDGTVKSNQKIADSIGNFTGPLFAGDWLGATNVALGDLDGDEIPDLASTAYRQNDGTIHILFLNSDGTVKAQQKIAENQGNFTGSIGFADWFGAGLANLEDLNGDNVVDLAAGAPGDDSFYILFLNSNGTVKSQQKFSGPDNLPGLIESNEAFGAAISNIGDLDGDGVTDIAVGSHLDDDGGTDRGALWIFFLNTDGTVKSHQKISDTSGNFNGILNDDDIFGARLANIKDFNGDGVTDIAVGAPGDDDGGNTRGAVWILFMN